MFSCKFSRVNKKINELGIMSAYDYDPVSYTYSDGTISFQLMPDEVARDPWIVGMRVSLVNDKDRFIEVSTSTYDDMSVFLKAVVNKATVDKLFR